MKCNKNGMCGKQKKSYVTVKAIKIVTKQTNECDKWQQREKCISGWHSLDQKLSGYGDGSRGVVNDVARARSQSVKQPITEDKKHGHFKNKKIVNLQKSGIKKYLKTLMILNKNSFTWLNIEKI